MTSTPPSPTLLENCVWVISKPIGFAQYDFDFETAFVCHHPYQLEHEICAIARMGAAPNYAERYREFLKWGVRLINSPEQYQRSSVLPCWYPLIKEFTPRSVCYERLPSAERILQDFTLPVFIKGERQTNKHSAQSVVKTHEQLVSLLSQWSEESILWWQRVVCREFIQLQAAEASKDNLSINEQAGLQKSYEFRTFWYDGSLVGCGKYWIAADYHIDPIGLQKIEEIGSQVCQRLEVPFLVIDFAKTLDGEWIVIECNDGQDSGYAGVNPRELWRKIIKIQQGKVAK